MIMCVCYHLISHDREIHITKSRKGVRKREIESEAFLCCFLESTPKRIRTELRSEY